MATQFNAKGPLRTNFSLFKLSSLRPLEMRSRGATKVSHDDEDGVNEHEVSCLLAFRSGPSLYKSRRDQISFGLKVNRDEFKLNLPAKKYIPKFPFERTRAFSLLSSAMFHKWQ